MAQYTAASAAIALFPKAPGFHQKTERLVRGITVAVNVTPKFDRFVAPAMKPIPVQVRPDIDNAALARIEQALRALPSIELDADATLAQQKIAELRARLESLRDKVVNLRVSDQQARAEIALIQRDLDAIDRLNPSIDVAVDAGAASAALSRVEGEASRLSGRTARVQVDADVGSALSGLATLTSALWAVNAMSVRPRVDVDVSSAVASIARLAAMISALGGLGGVIGGLAGAIGGLGAAGALAAGGLGVAVLGFLGVGKAVEALSQQQQQAGQTAAASARQQQAAAFAVANAQDRVSEAAQKAGQARADAAQNITRAETAAAAAVTAAQGKVMSAHRDVAAAVVSAQKARADAARSVAQAEQQAERSVSAAREQASRSLSQAVQTAVQAKRREQRATYDLRLAQTELNRAWEDGRRSLQDLQDQLDMSLIDQRQAALDLKDAREQLAAARASGDVEAIERAQIAYDRQVESIDQLSKRTQRLKTDNQAAQAAGVRGTETYRSAMESYVSAFEQASDARRASAQADAAVNQTRIDGARSVAQAEADGAARVAEARRTGAERVAAADARVASAREALSRAEAEVEAARIQGAQRVADAREQGARAIQAADAAVIDAQRALSQVMARTGDTGAAAADKVAQAFAKLSPAAAEFARYLFGLKPVLDQLSATAAAGLFPPLQAGIDTLLTRLPLINTVVGQLAAGMGAGLNLVLTTLANPFWSGFFAMLGNAAATVIPGLFGALMSVAQAAAMLITAFMPLAPAGFAVIEALSGLIGYLAPFLASAFGGMIPAAHAFIGALYPLGPLLAALSPILNILGVAVSQVLGAALQALTPILVALTPFIQHLATALAQQLVAAIQSLTPFLVGLATWMSQNPGLVMTLVGAVLAAIPVFNALGSVFAFLFGPVALLRLAMLATGASLAGLLAPLGGVFAGLARFLGMVGTATSVTGVLGTILRTAGMAVMGLGRMVLMALGPIGWIITAFGVLYSTCQPFRDAINQVLAIFGQLIGQIVSAVMPIFTALGDVVAMIAGVFGQLVSQLAVALIPVINLVAGVLSQLAAAILPPLVSIIGALVPVITLLGQVFAQVLMAVLGPVIGALQQLISAVLPPLMWWIQNVTIPVITFLADLFATVLSWAITNVLIPALNFLMPIITGLAGVLANVLAWVITNVVVPAINFLVPLFTTLGAAAMWLWTNAIQPAFGFIGEAARVLMAVIATALIAPLLIAWNLVSAAAMWLWTNAIRPAFQAIGDFIVWVWLNLIKPALDSMVLLWQLVIAPALTWLWESIFRPMFQAIGDFIVWVWTFLIKPALDAMIWLWQNVLAPAAMWLWNNVIKPAFEGIGAVIKWVWENVIRPTFDAVSGALDWLGRRFEDATNWIRDIWNRIKGYLAKPINFMIDVVWNRGVVPAWNAVAGLVGLGPIQPLGLIPEMATGGRIDQNGLIHGPGTGTSDSIMARVTETDTNVRVSKDEFLVNARATRRNLPALTAINNGADVVPGFAGGGSIWEGLWNTVRGQFPRARLTSAYRAGDSGYHGKGMAVDVAGSYPMAVSQMKEINHWIGRTFPGSTQLIHYPLTGGGINLLNGGPHHYNALTQAQHADHVHWAQDPAQPRGGGNGGTAWGAISTFFRDKVRDAFDSLTNPAIDALRGWIGPPPPAWRDVVPRLATKMRDTVRDWVFGKAEEKDQQASAGGNAMMGPVGDGEIFVIQQIADSARARGLGFDGASIGVATGIVESGLRNLNYGDRDSLGVFQQRPSQGWGSPAQIMNVRYAADKFFNELMSFNWRAMDPGAAAQRVQRSAFPAKYGAAMPRARQLTAQHGGRFDWGGVAVGKGVMLKDVIAPERVLDPVQTRDYDTLGRAVRAVDLGPSAAAAAERSGAGDRPIIENLYVTAPPGGTAADMAQALTWEVRKVRRGGVYS